ncbi:MAG: DUF6713 family protein [Pseudomonadota bacterium]
MRTFIYYLTIATLVTHELDAVRHSEWVLLYILRDLPAATAYTVFVVLHVPLIVAILWLSHHQNEKLQSIFRFLFGVLTCVHAIIHLGLEGSEKYFFEGWLADGLIFGSATLGAIYSTTVLLDHLTDRSN